MKKDRIFLSSPHMGGTEMDYIKEAFDTNWIAPLGANVTLLEKTIAKYVGRSYGVALVSGTAAIHLALRYLGVGKGDIVFCQSFSFCATSNPILYLGADIVFIDSEAETWNICPKALEKAYEKYPNPKAILFANLYGQTAKYDEIRVIAEKHGTPIIEDAAESLGASYKGVMSGKLGDLSILSFNGNKIITTSGGGMILTDDKSTAKKALFWSTQAREPYPWYQHEEIGYNYRLSNICAGIGCGQMDVLNKRVKQKTHINQMYRELFANNDLINFPPILKDHVSNYWLSVITIDKKSKVSFMDIINALEAENIEARPAWKPLHLQPVYKKYDFITVKENKSVAEEIFDAAVCLPSDTKMTNEQINKVAKIVNKLVK